MKRRELFFGLLIFALLSGFPGCSKNEKKSAAQAEPEKLSYEITQPKVVRIAVQPSAAFIPIYVVRAYGWLESQLSEMDYAIEWQDFEAGPPISDSLSGGNSDIGFLGDVPTITSLTTAYDKEIIGIPASGPNAYAVLVSRDNLFLNSIDDLKGKSVATVFGSTGHNLIGKLLKKENLNFSDITLINISAGASGGILDRGGVDAVVLWEPFVTRLIENYNARILVEGSYTDLRGTNSIIARKAFARENPKIVSMILTEYARAVKNLYSITEDKLKIISWQFRLSPEQIKSILNKYEFPVRFEKQDIKSLQDTANFLKSIDVVKREIWVEDYINTSYYRNSDAELYLNSKK